MFEMSEQTSDIFTALAKFQGELENASKSKAGHGYKYADLAQCINCAKEPLSKNGLSVVQMLGQQGERQTLTTMLTHSSGQWIRSTFTLVNATLMGGAGKNPAQVLGSAITYQRRYAYAAILGMAQEDDDAAVCAPVAAKPQQSPHLAPVLRKAITDKGYGVGNVEASWGRKISTMNDNELQGAISNVQAWPVKH